MHVPKSSRRAFMKWAAASPLLGQIAVAHLYGKAASAVGKEPRQNVYSRLGVKTVINCRGTWTYLSGSLEFPEVRDAQVEAAQYFVNVLDLSHTSIDDDGLHRYKSSNCGFSFRKLNL